MEPGETPGEALLREIREELDVDIRIGRLLTTVEYDYPQFHITLHCYLSSITRGDLRLKEHEAARWLEVGDLDSVNWLPADLQIIPLLIQSLV